MKKGFLFFCILVSLASCKVKQKAALKTATPEVAAGSTVNQKFDRPIVNSVVGKYNFSDSLNTQVFLRVNITNNGELMNLASLQEQFKVNWILQSDYGIKEKLQTGVINFSTPYAVVEKGYQYLNFTVPRLRTQSSAILLVEITHPASSTKYSFDLPIDFTAKRISTRYELYAQNESILPQFVNYIKVNEPFVVKSIQPSDEKLYLVRHKNVSKAALAPMSGSKRDVQSELKKEEIIEIRDREVLKFQEPGTYVLTQNPDNITDGYGFMIVPERYPRDTNPETLKEALVYMSTSKEIESTQGFDNSKEAMDMYFLNLAKGDEALAQKIIRSYYKRIEEANDYFTTYKEGWKTDKGMVYTIMGPPNRVQRNRTREVWLYTQNKNTSEIIYTFYKRPNAYSEQNYELVRYPEYSAFWYPYVEAWRTGKVAE